MLRTRRRCCRAAVRASVLAVDANEAFAGFLLVSRLGIRLKEERAAAVERAVLIRTDAIHGTGSFVDLGAVRPANLREAARGPTVWRPENLIPRGVAESAEVSVEGGSGAGRPARIDRLCRVIATYVLL